MSLRERRGSFSLRLAETANAARRLSLRFSGVPNIFDPPKEKLLEPVRESKVFGVDLRIAVLRSNKAHYMLPDVAYKCLTYLEQKGHTEEGIFRMSGSATEIQKMREQFDQGQDCNITSCLNPHTIAGLLKLFLRELPDPLLTTDKDAAEKTDILTYTRSIVASAPLENRCLLGCLFKLLHKISKQEDVTKMSVKNLVIVFSVALHCSGTVVTTLINHAMHIFPDDLLEKTTKVDEVTVKVEVDTQFSPKTITLDGDDIFGMDDDFQRKTEKNQNRETSSVLLAKTTTPSPVIKPKRRQKTLFDSDDEDDERW